MGVNEERSSYGRVREVVLGSGMDKRKAVNNIIFCMAVSVWIEV